MLLIDKDPLKFYRFTKSETMLQKDRLTQNISLSHLKVYFQLNESTNKQEC